ncbi:hypothetical protein RJ55_01044 [Drechmeria coniospora]|nr:hypothetical protein RJ55_01044 [Drechmeria coniospora]
MADRGLFNINYGHPGILTYVPAKRPQDGPGLLHTSRLTGPPLRFNIIGSSAELYPPSNPPTPVPTSHLWNERRLQRRWLFKTHPEAFMGDPSIRELLKEEKFDPVEDSTDRRHVLAIGQMTDLTDHATPRSTPLLAVATGTSGQQLRLARIDESQWQWGASEDVLLNLSVVDPIHREEETTWMCDPTPILQIRFVKYISQHDSIRWLLVQKATSIAILRPEYNPVPVLGAETTEFPAEGPSFINPNPLVTLHHRQTGGNLFADMTFNPAVSGRPNQLGAIDESGYWSIWNVVGSSGTVRKTMRLVQHKCGHLSEGLLGGIPSFPSYPAGRHGMIFVGGAQADDTFHAPANREGTMGTTASPSRHLLVWNSERFEILELESHMSLPGLNVLLASRTRADQILDVQKSPLNGNHVFFLTTQRLIWVDLAGRGRSLEASSKPTMLLSCTHIGTVQDGIRLSLSRASHDDLHTTMAFTYIPEVAQLAVYWFSVSPVTMLPQWHRHITQLPGGHERARARLVQVHPARLERGPGSSRRGPGSNYMQSDAKFYQVTVLGEDLGVRYGICASSSDPALELTLPTTRVGWSKSEQNRRWKKKRKFFLRHVGETFMVPDGMSEEVMNSLLKEMDTDEELSQNEEQQEKQQSVAVPVSSSPRPVPLPLMNRFVPMLSAKLDRITAQGELGLPANLFDALDAAAKRGLLEGRLPLMTWAEVAAELEDPAAYEAADNGMEEDVKRFLNKSDGKLVVTPLRKRSPESARDAFVTLSALREELTRLWLDPVRDTLPDETQQVFKAWIAELAGDEFLQSYGMAVQDVPLFGPRGSDAEGLKTGNDSAASHAPSNPRIASSSPTRPASTITTPSESEDACLQRLRLLMPSLESGTGFSAKPSALLSYWPTERGIDTQGYVSSVAAASSERFRDAKQRLQRFEAKRKAQSEKIKRPAFRGQGFPGSEGASQDASLPRMPPPGYAMSSQQAMPESSQTQREAGPSVTMSQPVSGLFGDRKKVKKSRRKSGFR